MSGLSDGYELMITIWLRFDFRSTSVRMWFNFYSISIPFSDHSQHCWPSCQFRRL